MTAVELHPTPSFGTAFRTHLRTLYYTIRSVRWLAAIAIAMITIGMAFSAYTLRNGIANAKRNPSPGIKPCLNYQHPDRFAWEGAKGMGGEDGVKVDVWKTGHVVMSCVSTGNTMQLTNNGKQVPLFMYDSAGIQKMVPPDDPSLQVVLKSLNATQTGLPNTTSIVSVVGQDTTVKDSVALQFQETAVQSSRTFGTIVMLILISIITLRAWRGESPAQRMYFWSMPLNRGEHTIAKVLAGWCWLMGFVALFVLVLTIETELVTWYTGAGTLLLDKSLHTLPTSAILAGTVAPFTIATVLYFVITIFAILFDNPSYWLTGVGAGMLIIPFALRRINLTQTAKAIESAWSGQYGLSRITSPDIGTVNLPHWWAVTGLWFAIAITATILAAYGRQPSLRR